MITQDCGRSFDELVLSGSAVTGTTGRHHVRLVNSTDVAVTATVSTGSVKDVSVALVPQVLRSATTFGGGQGVEFRAFVPAGQQITVRVGSSQDQTQVSVYDPTGRLVDDDITILPRQEVRDYPGVAQAGTWRIVAVSPLRRAFTASATFFRPATVTGSVTPGSTTTTVLDRIGESARYTFEAVAGQRATFASQPATWVGGRFYGDTDVDVYAVSPTGRVVAFGVLEEGTPFTERFVDGLLDETGTWTLVVDPRFAVVGQATWRFGLTQDVVVPIRPDRTLRVRTTEPGQQARVRFPASAGQTVTVTASTYSYRSEGAAPNGGRGIIRLVDPSGQVSAETGWWHRVDTEPVTITVPLDVTGRWTVEVDPDSDKVGTLRLSVALS